MIAIELSIPGLYAMILKLFPGENGIEPGTWIAFGCWLIALALTLISLIPRNYTVDPGILRRDPAHPKADLGIQDFFLVSSRYKRGLITTAAVFFFAGIVGAVINRLLTEALS